MVVHGMHAAAVTWVYPSGSVLLSLCTCVPKFRRSKPTPTRHVLPGRVHVLSGRQYGACTHDVYCSLST